MQLSQPPSLEQGAPPEPASVAESGVHSPQGSAAIPRFEVGSSGLNTVSPIVSNFATSRRFGQISALAIGILSAVLVGSIRNSHVSGSKSDKFSSSSNPASSTKDSRQLDRLKPQKQAEALLELAVGQSDGAVDQIASRVDRWQGQVKWNPQIATLTTAALNSGDMRVRESGIEVELAAYGLAKNSASLDYLLKTAQSSNHGQKIWALWALGLIGNRGVAADHVVRVLVAHLKDSDEESRRWSVEGLALVGTTPTIAPLLTAMHDDPSSGVRETAACSLAQAGMYTHEQRLSALPQLLNYTDDPSLDAQTHAWAFQALQEITKQHLPNDPSAWRGWYESTSSE